MPATMTHAYFAIDVFNRLDGTSKNLIKDNLLQYKMFSQSTDSLMFYNIETLKKGKKIRSFQYTFHTTNSQKFFCNLVHKIKRGKLYSNSDIISYLYGMICHYVLDSNVHPFVYYKTGNFNKCDKNTYKYNNMHSFMETFLDIWMMENKGVSSPYGFNVGKFTFDFRLFDESLKSVINSTFYEVFDIKNMSEVYYFSLKHMRRFLMRYRVDRMGIKKFFYKAIDKITPPNIFMFEALSYNYKPKDKAYFLNTEKEVWFNPIDPTIRSHESFLDLYNKSVIEAVDIIKKVTDYFNGQSINLKKVFTNKSYLSGLDCNIELDFKNFAF